VLGLKAPIRSTTAQKIAQQVVALARAGLGRRRKLNSTGENEAIFLSEQEEIAETGINPAERLLAKYHGEWKRDLRRAFADVRF
jgi:glutamate--cysteine ligase